MRKITNLLTLLLLAICSIGASAETATLTYGNIEVYKSGALVTPTSSNSFNHQVRSTTTPLITITIGTGDVVYNTSKFCFGNNNRTYTLAIDGGYVITGFTINYTRGSGVKFTSNGVTSEDDGILAVTGISTASTTFNVSGTSGAWQNYAVESIVVEYEQPNTVWNYTYTQYDGTTFASLGTGNGSVTATSAGYIVTPPSVAGYAFLGAADVDTHNELDITKPITATNIAFIYAPILQNIASASSSKAYTITAPRGFIHATSADATQFGVTSLSAGNADMQNPLHQWTFVTLDGNTYLYNVGTKKLASFNAIRGRDLVTSAPATVAGTASTYMDGYPVVLSFTKGSTTYIMNITGVPAVQIDGWTQHDEGNVLQIVEVPVLPVTPEVYNVTFTCSGGGLTSVYVDGAELALGTPIVLTSGATVSSSATVNAIATYNGFATLAEALADASFSGTVDVALVQNLTDITLNVTRGTKVIKTVTVTGVPEGTKVNVAEAVGSPAYVSDITPAEVVGTDVDQTVTVTYTSTLPFELSADPTDPATSTAYLMTLRKYYAHGNVLTSTSTYDLEDDTYYWTFGGNEWDGITVYNRGNGYMSVENAENSIAVFGTTPVAYTISANSNETNGFNLRLPGTNAYINDNAGARKVSTWNSSWAASDGGSCLKVYSIDDAVAGLVSTLEPYFTYAGCANALTKAAAANLQSSYEALVAAPSYSDYLALKATIEASLVPVTEGYYFVVSAMDAFMTQQSVSKSMYYDTSTNTIRWNTLGATAAEVLKLVAGSEASKYNLYVPLIDSYLASKTGTIGKTALDFEVLAAKPGAVVLAYNPEGNTDAAIHCLGHASGAGVSGALTNWTTGADASMWRLIPVDIAEITLISPEGVADGEEVVQAFANPDNAQLPLNIGVYTISEELATGAHLDTIATSQIAGGEGYIIKGVKGATVPLLPVNGTVDAPAGNLLVAGTGNEVNGGFMLAYKKGENVAKFWPITTLTVPTNRSYLPEGTPTRGLENIFGGIGEDVTGINGITTGAQNGAIYDLQGRRVNNATKGVYIINGKKVIK